MLSDDMRPRDTYGQKLSIVSILWMQRNEGVHLGLNLKNMWVYRRIVGITV